MRWLSRHDEDAFVVLVRQSSPQMLRTAFLLCSDLTEAEDLVQETWARVARRWQKVGGLDNPAAYAHRVMVNAAIDAQPARTRRRVELGPGPSPTGAIDPPDTANADVLTAVEHHDALRSALASLTPRQRAVLVLRYFDDLSEQQTADILGCSTGTVKSTASRALAGLRSAFAQDLLPHATTRTEGTS